MRVTYSLLGLLLIASCDGARTVPPPGMTGRSDAAVGADAMARDAGGRPATDCFEAESCVDTSDCMAGARCNQAVAPPTCQRLYCGAVGTSCSEEGFCATGSTCFDGICRACTDCGGQCVATELDPRNCGRCGNAVRFDQRCEGGQPTCELAGHTDCGDCVDLQSNPRHCGRCDNPVPPGLQCVNGTPGCGARSAMCGGVCVETDYAPTDCGRCGRICSSNGCVGGECGGVELAQETNITCATLCGRTQRGCIIVSGGLIAGLPETPEISGPKAGLAQYGLALVKIERCDEIPASTHQGAALDGMACACGE